MEFDPSFYRKAPEGNNWHPQVVWLYENVPYVAQRSTEWFKMRESVLTASDISAIIGQNKSKSAKKVFTQKTSPPVWTDEDEKKEKPVAIQHGVYYEPMAVSQFEYRMGKKVLDFSLIPHPTCPFIAASPDGITTDGYDLEVKCPYTNWYTSCPDLYYGQVQCQLQCTQLERAYFVVYQPQGIMEDGELDVFQPERMEIIMVERNDAWWARHFPKLESMYHQIMDFRNRHPDWNVVDHHTTPLRLINICTDVEEEQEK